MKRDTPRLGGRSRRSSGPPGPRSSSSASESALLGGSAFRDLLLEAVAVSCSPTRSA